MSKMMIVHLGVIVFAVCLSAQQVLAQNNTNISSTLNTTTMATGTYSSSTNSTSPTGAGVPLHADTFFFLIPILMAASLLQCYC